MCSGVPALPPFEAAAPPVACLLGRPPCPSAVQLGATFASFPVLSPELSTGPGTPQALSVHNIYCFSGAVITLLCLCYVRTLHTLLDFIFTPTP